MSNQKTNQFHPLPSDTTSSWPFTHLNLSNESTTQSSKNAILLSTGAYSPIHKTHTLVLDLAQATLESQGWNVLGGYISPSHDMYVGPKSRKKKTPFVNATHRVNMIEIAVQNTPWQVGKWEARCDGFRDFPVVAQELSKHISTTVRSSNITIFYVCGSDHYRNCTSSLSRFHEKNIGVIVIARDGESIANKSNATKLLYWCANTSTLSTASSTAVRQALQKGDLKTLNEFVDVKVIQYIIEHQLYNVVQEIQLETNETKESQTKGGKDSMDELEKVEQDDHETSQLMSKKTAEISMKKIIFIRHGQSEANITKLDDPNVLDAMLTTLGKSQASSWNSNTNIQDTLQSIEICLTSPLRRAMQTAALVFKNTEVPIVINRHAREKWWHLWQCRGIPHSELVEYASTLCRDINNITSLENLNQFWNPMEESNIITEKRSNDFNQLSLDSIHQLKNDLLQHDMNTIAVACHWGVIHTLLNIEPSNAEIIVTNLNRDGEFIIESRWLAPDTKEDEEETGNEALGLVTKSLM